MRPYEAARAPFCSKGCSAAGQRQGAEAACETCGRGFTRPPSQQGRFCSRRCRGVAHSVEKVCATCGRSFQAHRCRADGRKFCSRACRAFVKTTGDGREAARIHNHLRRARARARGGIYTAAGWLAKCEFWGWRCYLCRAELTVETAVIEHRTPLSRGGANWLANLAPACAECNQRKYTKTEAEFRRELGRCA